MQIWRENRNTLGTCECSNNNLCKIFLCSDGTWQQYSIIQLLLWWIYSLPIQFFLPLAFWMNFTVTVGGFRFPTSSPQKVTSFLVINLPINHRQPETKVHIQPAIKHFSVLLAPHCSVLCTFPPRPQSILINSVALYWVAAGFMGVNTWARVSIKTSCSNFWVKSYVKTRLISNAGTPVAKATLEKIEAVGNGFQITLSHFITNLDSTRQRYSCVQKKLRNGKTIDLWLCFM